MRNIIIIIVIIFITVITSTASAQTLCTDNSQCGQNIYYPDSTTGECIQKHGGVCDPENPVVDPEGCIWAFDSVDQSFCENPSPTSTPTTTSIPTGPAGPVPEELAVYNLNQALLPKEAIPQSITDDNPILRFLKSLQTLVGKFLFSQNPIKSDKTYAQSESIQQSQLPSLLKPTGNNPETNLQDFLGGSAGIYGVRLPKEIQSQSIQDSEKAFEKANFPAGIHPITEQ